MHLLSKAEQFNFHYSQNRILFILFILTLCNSKILSKYPNDQFDNEIEFTHQI